MQYKVMNAETGDMLYQSADKAKVFAKARELNTGTALGDIYVEDSDGMVYEDLKEA